MSPTCQIVQKLWNHCNVLRDDGMSYGEQLTSGLEEAIRGAL